MNEMKCPNCGEPEEIIEIGHEWCSECNTRINKHICDECTSEFLICGHAIPEKHQCDCTRSTLRNDCNF